MCMQTLAFQERENIKMNQIEKDAFAGAAMGMARTLLGKGDKMVRGVGKFVGGKGKGLASKIKPGVTKGKMDLRKAKVQRAVGGGTVAAGAGGLAAMTGGDDEKKASFDKADALFEKLAGYTRHGRSREKAKAEYLADMADDFEAADKASPGMSYLKGSHIQPAIQRLVARKQAYKSQQKGLGNIKTHIPFVGMGSKGQKALDKVRKEKSKK